MAAASDIQLTALDGDLKITKGDLTIGPSDTQHLYDLINDEPGFWKQFITVGVGINGYIQATGNFADLSNNIIRQLKNDGYSLTSPSIRMDSANSVLTVDPNATRV